MKIQHTIIGLLPFVFSCNEAIKKTSDPVTEDSVKIVKPVEVLLEPRMISENNTIKEEKDLYGYWVGAFMPDIPVDTSDEFANDELYLDGDYSNLRKFNKINISIDSLFEDTVIGHSVVAGNRRRFKGVYNLKENTFSFKVSEPGDDPYDGEFEFKISISDSILSGTWKAYKAIETPKRKFELKKRKFVYNPDEKLTWYYFDWNKVKSIKEVYEGEVYITEKMFATTGTIYKFNPSKQLLKKKDVENMKKADIFILRNSIYARHGYSFKKRPLRYFFDSQDWYIPMFTDITMYLSDIEKENIKLLLSYEKHAAEYYDTFGR